MTLRVIHYFPLMKEAQPTPSPMPQGWLDQQTASALRFDPATTEVHIVGDLTIGPTAFLDHWAQDTIFLLRLVEGSARIELTGAPPMKLKAGAFAMLFPGRTLTVKLQAKKNRLVYLSLRGKGVVDAVLRFGFWDRQCEKAVFADEFFAALLALFAERGRNGHDPDVLRLSERILQSLATRVRSSGGNAALCDAVRTIHTMPREKFTAEAAAEILGMTRVTLANVFRRAGFPPPGEYIAQVRTMLAQEMIYDRSLTMRQIARRLGFATATAFTVFFKRRTGLTPRAYRQHPIQ